MADLTIFEIKILFKCAEKLLSKSYASNLYGAHKKKERDAAIKNLIQSGLIDKVEMPRPGANKTPVFYKITDKGNEWVEEYLKNYPK